MDFGMSHRLARVMGYRDTAEAGAVGIGRMGADSDAEPRGPVDRLGEGCGIPRVPAAGDAGAGDDGEHRLVVGRRNARDGLTQVGIEVDPRHAPR